jgi:hypothetical protein
MYSLKFWVTLGKYILNALNWRLDCITVPGHKGTE